MSSSSSSSSGTPRPSVNPDSRNGTPATSAPASPATLTWTDTLSDDEEKPQEKPQERPVVKNGPRNAPHDGPATGPNIRGPHFPALKPQMNMTQAICYYFKSLSDSGLYPESAIPEMAQIAANRYIAEAKKTNPPVWTSVPLVPPRPQGQEQPQPRTAQPASRAPKPRAAQEQNFQKVPSRTRWCEPVSEVLKAFAFKEDFEVKVVDSRNLDNFLPSPDQSAFILPKWKKVTRNGKPWNSNLYQTCFLSPMLDAPFMIELNSDGSFHQWVQFVDDRARVVPCDLATVIDIHNANMMN